MRIPLLLACGLLALPYPSAAQVVEAGIQDLRGSYLAAARRADDAVRLLGDESALAAARIRNQTLNKISDLRDGIGDLEGADLQARIEQAMALAGQNGQDVLRLRAMYEATKQVVRRMELGGEAPASRGGAAETLGAYLDLFGRTEAADAERRAQAQAQKVALYKRINIAFLDALVASDPAEGARKFRAYAYTVRELQAAEAQRLVAEAEALAAEQQLASDLLAAIPPVGTALDALALATGEQPLTGEQLKAIDYLLAILPDASAYAVETAIKRNPAARDMLTKLTMEGLRAAQAPQGGLARAFGDKLVRAASHTAGLPTMAAELRRQEVSAMIRRADEQAVRMADPALAARNSAWNRSLDDGARRAGEFGALLEEEGAMSRKTLDAYVALRQHPAAVAAMKAGDDEFLRKVNAMEALYFGRPTKITPDGKPLIEVADGSLLLDAGGQLFPYVGKSLSMNNGAGVIDKAALSSIKNDVRSLLARPGTSGPAAGVPMASLPPSERLRRQVDDALAASGRHGEAPDLELKILNVTSKKARDIDVGSDRDVTVRLFLKFADGSMAPAGDVPADIVRGPYAKALHDGLQGAPPSRSRLEAFRSEAGLASDLDDDALREKYYAHFAQRMDHTVTDALSADAYRPGMDIDDFIGKPTRGLLNEQHADDLGRTFSHKGSEWFDRGREAATKSPELKEMYDAEGMRQLTKQADLLTEFRVEQFKLDHMMTGRAAAAIEIMRKVTEVKDRSRRMSPADAEARIRQLGYADLSAAAEDIGRNYAAIEKEAVRRMAAANDKVAELAGRAAAEGTKAGLEAVKEAPQGEDLPASATVPGGTS